MSTTMHVSERIAAIARACRHDYFPEPLVTVICQYLYGQVALVNVQREWYGARSRIYSINYLMLRGLVGLHPNQLDDIDRRMLDVCGVIDRLPIFFYTIANSGPVIQARGYLMSQGMGDLDILAICVESLSHPHMGWGPLTALEQMVLSDMPHNLPNLLQIAAQNRFLYRNVWLSLVSLLLRTEPPDLDRAWHVTQAMPPSCSGFGLAAAMLFRADPVRFTSWARYVAGPSSPASENDRSVALEALVEYDVTDHIDLAIAAARTPLLSDNWHAGLQCVGLQAAYQFDPIQYMPLVEQAAIGSNFPYGLCAVDLLAQTDFDRARPILQRCVAHGSFDAGFKALWFLLEREWEGLEAYEISLLAHRAKQIRDVVIDRLIARGDTVIERVTPLLAHQNSNARLAAVHILGQVSSERTRAVLQERLNAEPLERVRCAILDMVSPRLAQDPSEHMLPAPIATVTAKAIATMCYITQPALTWCDPAQTGLRWADDDPVPPVVVNYLLYRQSRVNAPQLAPDVQSMLDAIDSTTACHWALALWDGWLMHGASIREAWCLQFVGALGDERLVEPLRQQVVQWAQHNRGAVAVHAVHALGLIGSMDAFRAVEQLQHVKHRQIQRTAQQVLGQIAAPLGITQEELADRSTPRLGFGASRTRVFDYGRRQFTVRLGIDLALHLYDGVQQRITALPKPDKHDDLDRAVAAQAAWKQLKIQLKQVVTQQTGRLEQALVSQRAWDVGRWRELFLGHPLLCDFAVRLVWLIGALGNTQRLFRPLEDGTLTNVDDEPVDLPPDGWVRLAHPIELDGESVRAWQEHLADYEIAQPFPQISRPIVRILPEEHNAIFWETYRGYLMNDDSLKRRYLKASWERGEVGDNGIYEVVYRSFSAAGVVAVLETTGLSVGYRYEGKTALKRLAFLRSDHDRNGSYGSYDLRANEAHALKLSMVPPVIFSEAAADVQAFAAIGQYDAEWERKV